MSLFDDDKKEMRAFFYKINLFIAVYNLRFFICQEYFLKFLKNILLSKNTFIIKMEIKINNELIDYEASMNEMEKRHSEILVSNKEDLVWFLQHHNIYTAGISAKPEELLKTNEIPVCYTKRGGKFTYHGPGQLVCYIVCNLKKYSNGNLPDVKCFVSCLEEIVIKTLANFGLKSERKTGKVGVWVKTQAGDKKIAAIGVKFSKGITTHGFAININPDISNFNGIIPCGISEFGVCSMESLGVFTSFDEVVNECKKFVIEAQKMHFFQNNNCIKQ